MLLSLFSPSSGKGIRLGKESEQSYHGRTEKTLLAIREFKRYLDGVEKDLTRMSKRFSNKEITQGVDLRQQESLKL